MATTGLLEFHYCWILRICFLGHVSRGVLCAEIKETNASKLLYRGQSRTRPQEASARHAPAKSKSGEPRQNRETFRPRLFIARASRMSKTCHMCYRSAVHGGGLEYEGHMAWVQHTSDPRRPCEGYIWVKASRKQKPTATDTCLLRTQPSSDTAFFRAHILRREGAGEREREKRNFQTNAPSYFPGEKSSAHITKYLLRQDLSCGNEMRVSHH